MIPTLSAELATAHHTELLRAAEARRRARAVTAERGSLLTRLTGRVERLAVHLHRPFSSTARSASTVCCA